MASCIIASIIHCQFHCSCTPRHHSERVSPAPSNRHQQHATATWQQPFVSKGLANMAWRANPCEWGMEITKRTTRTSSWTTVRMSSDVAALYFRASRDFDAASSTASFGPSDSDYSDAETTHRPAGPPPPGPPPPAPRGFLASEESSEGLINQSIFEMDLTMMVDPIEQYCPSRRLRAKTSLAELLNEGLKKNKHFKVKSVQSMKARRRWRQLARKKLGGVRVASWGHLG